MMYFYLSFPLESDQGRIYEAVQKTEADAIKGLMSNDLHPQLHSDSIHSEYIMLNNIHSYLLLNTEYKGLF